MSMNLNLTDASDSQPLTGGTPLSVKIMAFVASLALGLAGILNATLAITAYIGGDLVGAVGKGADQAATAVADSPESDPVVSSDTLHDVAKDANAFALRAKLIALAIAVLAGAQLLGGELVRRRYRTKVVPIVLGVAIAGEAAMAIALHPSILTAIGVGACGFGIWVWTRFPAPARITA